MLMPSRSARSVPHCGPLFASTSMIVTRVGSERALKTFALCSAVNRLEAIEYSVTRHEHPASILKQLLDHMSIREKM